MRRRRGYLWALRPYFGRVPSQLLLGSVGGLTSNLAVVLPPVLLGRAVDATLALERGHGSVSAVTHDAMLFVLATALYEGFKMMKRWWLNLAWASMKASIRADAFRGVMAWPFGQIERIPAGDVLARVVGDVEVLGDGFGQIVFETWDTVLLTVSLSVAMVVSNWRITALALLPVPLAMVAGAFGGRAVARRAAATRSAATATATSVHEHLAALRDIRLCGGVGRAVEHLAGRSRAQADAEVAASRLQAGLEPLYALLLTTGVILVIWRGGDAVIGGTMTVGGLVAFLQLYLRFVGRAPGLPVMLNRIRAGDPAWERLSALLAKPQPGKRTEGSFQWGPIAPPRYADDEPGPLASGPVGLSVREATFAFAGSAEAARAGLSFEVPAGAFVVVTGGAGAGKTALARLLVGIEKPQSGLMDVHGPLGRVGYLPQKSLLFSGRIEDNVALAWPASTYDPSIATALRLANRRARPPRRPSGRRRPVSRRCAGRPGAGRIGARLSGGQRRRIELAHAIAAPSGGRPGLLVLDEPFSGLDLATQDKIADGLRRAFGPNAAPQDRATVVVLSSRLTGMAGADLIVVLDRGRVVERGSHRDLLAAGGVYRRMADAQSHHDRSALGDNVNRCTADIDAVSDLFTDGIATLVGQTVPLVLVVAAMIALSPTLSAVAALSVAPVVALTRFMRRRVRDAQRANRDALGRLAAALDESLEGAEVVKAFSSERGFSERFRAILCETLAAFSRSNLFNTFYAPTIGILAAAVIAVLLSLGVRDLFGLGALRLGTLTAFTLLYQRVFTPITALGEQWQQIQEALSGAERVFRTLALPLEEHGADQDARPGQGIVLRNVGFGYDPSRRTLAEISFQVRPGEHVSLMGRTGARKSTIVDLLACLR